MLNNLYAFCHLCIVHAVVFLCNYANYPQCGTNKGILFHSILFYSLPRNEQERVSHRCPCQHQSCQWTASLCWGRTSGTPQDLGALRRRCPLNPSSSPLDIGFTACEPLFASLINGSCFMSGPCSFTFLLCLGVVSVLLERREGRVGQLLVQLVLGTVALVQLSPCVDLPRGYQLTKLSRTHLCLLKPWQLNIVRFLIFKPVFCSLSVVSSAVQPRPSRCPSQLFSPKLSPLLWLSRSVSTAAFEVAANRRKQRHSTLG